jgi:hypothetical protein
MTAIWGERSSVGEAARVWLEVSFNIVYLVVVWALVVAMVLRADRVPVFERAVARRARWAFGLLALGDTGHVGFRVLAYAQGGLQNELVLWGRSWSLVGMGALATAITVTLFYAIVLDMWRCRFDKTHSWFEYLLLAAAGIRLLLMIPPANEWNAVVPPQPWSLYRNLPLVVQGVGVAYLILRDAWIVQDRTFLWIGILILVSFACYAPVILFVQQAPLIGMLMIPKTMAYVAIGLVVWFDLYWRPSKARGGQRLAEG